MTDSIAFKKTISLVCVLFSILLFQNCGGEGFVSAKGTEEFDSFEDAYPEMNEDGQIDAKFEKSRNFYEVSPEVDKEYTYIYRALPSRPAPTPGTGNGGLGGGPVTGGGGGSNPSNDVDQKEPTFIGQDRDYYEDEFNFPAVVSRAGQIKSFQSKIFPARYYGLPKYQQAFGGNGLGIISTSQFLGTTNKKTPAVFYQYKLDYYREKAVVFVISDGLSRGKLGASTVSASQSNFVALAKMGYLVVHLQPRNMRSAVLTEYKCGNLGQFFFNGVQEVRRAISTVVSKANYYGIDKNNMFIIGFGEGGTLAAETAFLDASEAQSRYGAELAAVPGFANKGLFRGVAVSGGGIIDRATIQGASRARMITIHGGNDRKVSVLGEQIYSCPKNSSHKINPLASKYLSDEVTARLASSASVLHCGKNKPSEVRPVSKQMNYFATYFHNIIANGGQGIAQHYRYKHCTSGGRDEQPSCSFPVPLINQVVSLYVGQPVGSFYTKGPCTPKQRPSDNDGGGR